MEESEMQSTTIAVDLASNVFEIAASRQSGKVAERHRPSRSRLLPFFAERQPAVVLLEAKGFVQRTDTEFSCNTRLSSRAAR
jgi:hypothetical protein